MAFSCIFFMRVLILCFGIFSLVSFSMECSWMAPLTPAVMVISGLTFQPLFCMLLISGSYLVCLWVRASFGNLSWQYVNSRNWIVWLGEGIMGVGVWLGTAFCSESSSCNPPSPGSLLILQVYFYFNVIWRGVAFILILCWVPRW